MSFFNELKRRNVFKVGTAYVVVAWLVTQVLQVVFESFGTPDWVMKTMLVLLATGLPFALFFAWAFEITPEGLKRETEVDRSQSITRQTGHKFNYTITALLVVALAYFAYDKFVLGSARDAAFLEAARQEATAKVDNTPQASAEPDKSIAVLPFVNMSGDEENEYFSDGLTEELLNSLARIKELKVTGRTSSFAFKGKNTDLREIGRALGVANILEGSVRKANNRVRITAQLIKAEDGYHLWSGSFDRELDDVFAIQEEIAMKVTRALAATLLNNNTEPLVNPGTSNTQAYEAYLRGRYLFKRSPDDIQVQNETEKLYQKALELDPGFTLAWFGQFEVLVSRRRSGRVDYRQAALQLRELADKLVAMDPQLPESHVAFGVAAQTAMRWADAEAAYHRALDLYPGNMNALRSLVGLMSILDRPGERLEFAQQALARDPLDLQALLGVVGAYRQLGRCNKAQDIANRALSLVPEASRFYSSLAACWQIHYSDNAKAIEYYKKEPLEFLRDTGLAISYNKSGMQEEAQRALAELIAANGEAASFQYAQIYAQWGETDKALDALERAWAINDAGIVLTHSDRYLRPLQDQPRYIALLKKWQGGVTQ